MVDYGGCGDGIEGWEDFLWTEAMVDVPAEMTTIQSHQGEVTHMAVLDNGAGHTRMVVTASNAEQTLRTWGL